MTVGIKYISHGAATGYGLAGFAYIRALHNASVPVWPFFFGARLSPGSPGNGQAILPLGRAAEGDANLADLPALMRATARPIAYDTIVVHSIPELWRRFTEADKRLIGYTVWETDALPEHWPDLLDAAEAILVPSHFNAKLFARSGVTRPVHVVPHIRRHAWSESARDDGVALRSCMGIPADHFVFYTISAWDPRKAVGELIDAFAREFRAEDRVTLLVKTSAAVDHAAIEGQPGAASVQELTARIVDQASRKTGRRAANVVCIAADDISGRVLDAIHATADAYISLTHGEGWGLGAFDAATLGKPVIMTGWGGQLDYLGDEYPGLVRYEMIPVTGWLPTARYRATQRWASADRSHATQLMRAAVARDSVLLEAAASVREIIAKRFAEPVVARQLLAAIGGGDRVGNVILSSPPACGPLPQH